MFDDLLPTVGGEHMPGHAFMYMIETTPPMSFITGL